MAPSWMEKFIVREDPTPDTRRSTEQAALEVHYTALADHRRILGMQGDKVPRYQVQRRAILGAWGDKCSVTSPVQGDVEVATIDFHTFPSPRREIRFTQRHHEIKIKVSEPQYDAGHGLGRLHWKGTGMVPYGRASWELRDESSLVVSVTIDDDQVNGLISLWRDDLDAVAVDELIIVGISQIESHKTLLRNAKTSAVAAVTSASWLVIP